MSVEKSHIIIFAKAAILYIDIIFAQYKN